MAISFQYEKIKIFITRPLPYSFPARIVSDNINAGSFQPHPMDYEGSNILLYIDTEFADSYLVEIGIVNAAGDVVINTFVLRPQRQ